MRMTIVEMVDLSKAINACRYRRSRPAYLLRREELLEDDGNAANGDETTLKDT